MACTKGRLVAAAFGIALTASLVEAQQISVGPPNFAFQAVGVGNGSTTNAGSYLWGQTFTTPGGLTQLDQFTFQLRPATSSYIPLATQGLTLNAYVYAWDSMLGKVVGPQLFKSSPLSVASAPGYSTLTVNTGGLAMTPGMQYVAFLDPLEFRLANPTLNSFVEVGAVQGDPYAGGNAVWMNNYSSTFTTDNFSQVASADLAFTATFSANVVPEPESYLMLAGGMVTLLGMKARRRRAA